MSEPGSQEIVPQRKASKQDPTKDSEGFLGKMVHGVKEAGIKVALNMVPGGAYASAVRREGFKREAQMTPAGLTARPENQFESERVRQQDPTEASKGFLRKFRDRLFTDNPELIQLIFHGVGTAQFGKEAIADFMQGNYTPAAVEGMIAGLLLVSPIRLARRITRNENNQET